MVLPGKNFLIYGMMEINMYSTSCIPSKVGDSSIVDVGDVAEGGTVLRVVQEN